ncbi:MAG: sigma-70 family RNA polymerase sigma factor [Erysipelotrichaceae bacterium]
MQELEIKRTPKEDIVDCFIPKLEKEDMLEIEKEISKGPLEMKEILEGTNEQLFLCILNDETLTEADKNSILDRIAESNIRLVYYVVNKKNSYINMLPLDEMASAGFLGYAKAIKTYNPMRGVKFATYAINCIQNEISFCLRKERKHFNNNISVNYSKHVDKNGNDLSIEDTMASLDSTPKEDMTQQVIRNLLMAGMNRLSPMEKYVAIYRYGFDRGITLTQKEIARLVSMSQANISKIERNIAEKLKYVVTTQM